MMIDQRNVNFVANDSRCVNETTISRIRRKKDGPMNIIFTKNNSFAERTYVRTFYLLDKRVLSMHLATHSERKFACNSCDVKFTLEAQLNRHVK